MWLTAVEISSRTGVHEKTIKRRAKKFGWPMRYEHNPKGQPILKFDFSADIIKDNLQKKFSSVRTVRTKSNLSADSADTKKESSADTFKGKESSADSADNFDDKSKIILTGQENKPELSHKGTDSSPVPAPFSGLQLQKQQQDLFHPEYNTKPVPEVPDSYKRVGQLRAQLCTYVLDLISKSGMKKAEAYDRIVSLYNFGSIVNELKEYKPNKTISEKTLRRWIKIYKEGGHDYLDLIPNYAVGPGSIRITPEEENYLLREYLSQNKPYIGSIITNLKTEAMHGDIVSPSSVSTLRRWLLRYIKNNKRVVALAREGEKHLRDNLIKYIERDSSVLVFGDVFIVDGNMLNFRIIDPETGKPKRMMFIPVMDWASRMIIGGSIAATEDTMNIANAYRNAFINYGGVPRVIYMDNGKAFRSRYFTGKKGSDLPDLEDQLGGLFKRLGIEEVFARAYNARAKIIERWFRTFNNGFERFIGSYTGASISDKPAHMNRNEPFMKKLVDDRPLTKTEAQNLISYYINHYYHKQIHKSLGGKTPEEVFLAHPCPKERRISAPDLDILMLKHDLKQVNRNGITFLKQNYWHQNLADHIKEKLYFRYDPNDISFIQVYNEHGKFICTARPIEKTHPMAIISSNKEVTEKQIKKNIRYQNREVKETKEQLLKTLSNTQRSDHKFIEHKGDETSLFNTGKPALPAQSKTMDQKMIEQTLKVKTHDDASQPKKKNKLDTDIKTLGLA